MAEKDAGAPAGLTAPEVEALVTKSVTAAMEPFAAALKGKVTSNMSTPPPARADADDEGVEGEDIRVGKNAVDGHNIHFARYLKAVATAGLSNGRQTPEIVAKSWATRDKSYNRVVKALGTINYEEGGVLVPEEFKPEVIEYLRNTTVMRKLGARSIPLKGSMQVPRQVGTSTAYWGDEGEPITPSQPSLGGDRMSEKKLTGLVPVNNDLLRAASINAEEWIRNDVLNVIAQAEDIGFLKGNSPKSPTGLRYLTDAAHIYNATQAGAVATLQEVRNEIAKARRLLKKANQPMTSMAWISSPRTEEFLDTVADGNGNAIYSAEVAAGRLKGAPAFYTNNVPDDEGGGTNESWLIYVDGSQLIIGDAMTLAVEFLPNAVYEEGGVVKSGVSRDQSVFRAIQKVDFGMRHRKAAVVIKALKWGA